METDAQCTLCDREAETCGGVLLTGELGVSGWQCENEHWQLSGEEQFINDGPD